MKPRNNQRNVKHLPLMVCIAMTATQLAQGGIFDVDTAGNGQPTPADNGANTITADGGTSTNPFVSILNGVGLTGNVGSTSVLDISATNYTVTNNGSLNGTDHIGILSSQAFTLINNGLVQGNGSNEGILSVGGATSITNSLTGTIRGGDDGIFFDTDGGSVINRGLIEGVIGLNSSGIDAADDVTVSNYGTIQGLDDGADVGDGATLTNFTVFRDVSPFDAISGGQIIGVNSGIVADDNLIVVNQNLGLIQGTAGNGVDARDNTTITNSLGAQIRGSFNGINVGDDAIITNNGTITGGNQNGIDAGENLELINSGTILSTNDTGVSAGELAVITNTGLIEGKNGVFLYDGNASIINTSTGTIRGTEFSAILVGSGPSGVTVTNSGLITSPTNSFSGDALNDTLNLNLGSSLVGNVIGDGGTDVINFNGGLTTPGGTNNKIQGDLDEISLITKTGSGTAFIGLPGDSLYDIEVNQVNITSGGLYLNGDVFGFDSAKTVINAGGSALGGIGTWDADLNITNGGISSGATPINLTNTPTQAVGVLNITGDVDHSPGSFIRMDIRPDTNIINGVNSDRIVQTGVGNSYDVGGAGLRISATNNNRIIRDGTYNVVDSALAITGTGTFAGIGVQFNNNINGTETGFVGSETGNTGFSNLNTVLGLFSSVSLSGGGTNLDLVIDHDYAGLAGLTDNQRRLGGALDDSITSSDLLTQDFISALDYSSLEVVQNTLASIDPSGVLDMSSTIVSSNYRLHRLAQDHLAGTRTGTVTQATPAMTDSKGAMVAPATMTSSNTRGSVWGTASFDWKDSSGDATADFDGQDASITAGVDYRVAPNVLLGVLLDGSRGDYDYDGGSSDNDSYRIAVYGTYGSATGLYADFLFGYGDHNMDLDQDLGGILSGTSSNSSTDASSFQGLATVGYAMESNQVKHGPFAGLEYQSLDVDGFTRKGAFPVKVDGFDNDSFRALIGYRVEATMDRFKPYASVAYAHEFEDGSTRTSATLPSGASFDVEGGAQDSAFLISLGTGINLMQNLDLNVGYHGEISTGDGIDNHGGTLGVNYSF